MPRFSAIIVALSVLTVCLASQAKGKQDKEARSQFERGVELFDEGKFDQAVIAFERAYELKPSFKILYNIGQTENGLGHYTAALVAYEQYLEQGGKKIAKKRREKVVSEVERLRSLVGSINVSGAEDGAQVFVDSRSIGEVPLEGPYAIDIGEHEVIIKIGGVEVHKEIVRVSGGKETQVNYVPVVEKEPEELPAIPKEEEPPTRLWTWVALGVGGAVGIAGGVIGGVALSNKNAIEDGCVEDHCLESDKAERDKVGNLSLTADVLFGVAAVGVAAGIVLYFVEPKLGGDDGEELVVAPTASSDSVGLAIAGRF